MEKSNKNRIFAALESATLPIEQRTRAELFVYMRMEYTNPPLGTAALLANLQNEGLVIMDERKANAFLENVSYFRFAAYLRPFKASDKNGYKENATFEKQQLCPSWACMESCDACNAPTSDEIKTSMDYE